MWGSLIPVVGTLLDKLIPDPQAAADAKLKVIEMAQKGELAVLDAEVRLALGQIEVNKEEAKTDLFKGGWRPFVGWICALGLGIQFIIHFFSPKKLHSIKNPVIGVLWIVLHDYASLLIYFWFIYQK